jgi:hypothetical protein
MYRIIKTRPINVHSDTLARLDKYRLVNEKFAFDFGLALMGIDTFQMGII